MVTFWFFGTLYPVVFEWAGRKYKIDIVLSKKDVKCEYLRFLMYKCCLFIFENAQKMYLSVEQILHFVDKYLPIRMRLIMV